MPVGRYQYGVTELTIDDAKMGLVDTAEIPVDIRYDVAIRPDG